MFLFSSVYRIIVVVNMIRARVNPNTSMSLVVQIAIKKKEYLAKQALESKEDPKTEQELREIRQRKIFDLMHGERQQRGLRRRNRMTPTHTQPADNSIPLNTIVTTSTSQPQLHQPHYAAPSPPTMHTPLQSTYPSSQQVYAQPAAQYPADGQHMHHHSHSNSRTHFSDHIRTGSIPTSEA